MRTTRVSIVPAALLGASLSLPAFAADPPPTTPGPPAPTSSPASVPAPAAATTTHAEGPAVRTLESPPPVPERAPEFIRRSDETRWAKRHLLPVPTLSFGAWDLTFSGMVRADAMVDSTQSFSDVVGNTLVERPFFFPPPPPAPQITYRGEHGRTTGSIAGSRLGFQLRTRGQENAPLGAIAATRSDDGRVRIGAMFELDFAGFQPPIGYEQAAQVPEASVFANPIPRLRHAFAEVGVGRFTFLLGQTWGVFGGQPYYQPATLSIQGIPSSIYSREAQLRATVSAEGHSVAFEQVIALSRPPSRGSRWPSLEGMSRLSFPRWRGIHTSGAHTTRSEPASIAVSGILRRVTVPEFSQLPEFSANAWMGGISAHFFLPVIAPNEDRGTPRVGRRESSAREHIFATPSIATPAQPSAESDRGPSFAPSPEESPHRWSHHHEREPERNPTDYDSMANALSFSGEFAYGSGISDFYSMFTGGLQFPTIANTSGVNPPPTYPQNIDNGLVSFDLQGNLFPIQWTTGRIGGEYHLPFWEGRLFVSSNVTLQHSNNIDRFTRPTSSTLPDPQQSYFASGAQVRKWLLWFDANLYYEITRGARIGVYYAHHEDHYVDDVKAVNHRFGAVGAVSF